MTNQYVTFNNITTKINIIDNNSYQIVGDNIYQDNIISLLDYIYETEQFQNYNDELRIILTRDGSVLIDNIYTLNNNSENYKKMNKGQLSKYNHYINYSIKYDFMRDSDKTRYETGDKFIFLNPDNNIYTNNGDTEQHYLDGKEHCFLYPIIQFASEHMSAAVSKSTKERYSTILDKCNRYIIQYEKGIPESKIQNVINDLHINVDLFDIANKCYKSYKSTQKALTTFKYFNTRFNHLDHYASLNNPVQLTKEQMFNKYKELLINNNHFTYKGSCSKYISCINTFDCFYVIKDDEYDIYNNFMNETGINNIPFDMLQDTNLTNFILDRKSTRLNSSHT